MRITRPNVRPRPVQLYSRAQMEMATLWYAELVVAELEKQPCTRDERLQRIHADLDPAQGLCSRPRRPCRPHPSVGEEYAPRSAPRVGHHGRQSG